VSALPIIEVSALDEGDASAVRALRQACESVGFFYAAQHGIDPSLEQQLETLSHRFFALPPAAKEAVAMRHSGNAWRGWFPVGGELTSGAADLKEGLYFGAELPPSPLPLHGPNLFPSELPELRPVILRWMRELERLGQRILAGLALSLGLDRGHFANGLTRTPLCLFRAFHYPTDDTTAWGVGEHTDYGLLTLLKQDDCGGLEVKTPQRWLHAEPVPGTFVCNLGDMLDRMTGGRYRSTPHRVRNISGKSRCS
jgi:isopenicillin N synthase-like dioxygenase